MPTKQTQTISELKKGARVRFENQEPTGKNIEVRFDDGSSVKTTVAIGNSLEIIVGEMSATLSINDVNPNYEGLQIVGDPDLSKEGTVE
jgi:hypothetical protein